MKEWRNQSDIFHRVLVCNNRLEARERKKEEPNHMCAVQSSGGQR